MIFIRRLLIVPLGLLFMALFLVTLVILRANETFLEPSFYKEQLVRADIYDFVLDDLLTSALDELREKDPGTSSDGLEVNPLVTLSLTTEDLASAVQKTFPAPWVQEQVEQLIDQAGGYITGEQEGFEIRIDAAGRARTAKEELESLVLKAQVYNLLDEVVASEVDKSLEDGEKLPFGVSLTGEDISAAVKRVAPEEWLDQQVNLALDELVAYAVGDQDGFQVRVQLAERSHIALQEVKDLLRKASFYDLLFEEVVDPMLRKNLPLLTSLPFGVDISDEEVLAALHQVAPLDWVQGQVEAIIDEVGPYLTGESDTFQAVVPLAERREVALVVIEDLARTKLEEVAAGLPACGLGQLPLPGDDFSFGGLPLCIPFGVDVVSLIDSLEIDIAAPVREMIGARIPDQVTYSEVDLRHALTAVGGKDAVDTLDKVREVISEGWAYTDTDLKEDILDSQGEDAVEVLDDIRAALSQGWTYTEADLRQDVLDAGNEVAWNNLSTFRSGLVVARDFQYLVYVPVGLLLALIGLLGGRRWWSRFAWASVVLGISSAIVLAAAGPGFSLASQRFADEARASGFQDMEGAGLLAAQKSLDVLLAVGDEFFSGIADASMTLLAVALIVFGLSQVWRKLFPGSRPVRR